MLTLPDAQPGPRGRFAVGPMAPATSLPGRSRPSPEAFPVGHEVDQLDLSVRDALPWAHQIAVP